MFKKSSIRLLDCQKVKKEQHVIYKKKTDELQRLKDMFAGEYDDGFADLLDDIKESSFKITPSLFFLAALSAITVLHQGWYGDGENTNIYSIGIGYTGIGKDGARQWLNKLLNECGAGECSIGSESRSNRTQEDPIRSGKKNIFYNLDEAGSLFTGLSKDKSSWAKNAVNQQTTFFSCKNHDFPGSARGEKGEGVFKAEDIHLTIYGVAAKSTLIKGIDESAITSGQVNRYLFLEEKDSTVNPTWTQNHVFNREILERFKKIWQNSEAAKATKTRIPIEISREDSIYVRSMEMNNDNAVFNAKNEIARATIIRVVDIAKRIAKAHAIWTNPDRPVFRRKIFEAAMDLVESASEEIISMVLENKNAEMSNKYDEAKSTLYDAVVLFCKNSKLAQSEHGIEPSRIASGILDGRKKYGLDSKTCSTYLVNQIIQKITEAGFSTNGRRLFFDKNKADSSNHNDAILEQIIGFDEKIDEFSEKNASFEQVKNTFEKKKEIEKLLIKPPPANDGSTAIHNFLERTVKI